MRKKGVDLHLSHLKAMSQIFNHKPFESVILRNNNSFDQSYKPLNYCLNVGQYIFLLTKISRL